MASTQADPSPPLTVAQAKERLRQAAAHCELANVMGLKSLTSLAVAASAGLAAGQLGGATGWLVKGAAWALRRIISKRGPSEV